MFTGKFKQVFLYRWEVSLLTCAQLEEKTWITKKNVKCKIYL